MSIRNKTLDHPLASPTSHFYVFDPPQGTARRCSSEPSSSPILGHNHRKEQTQSPTASTASAIKHTVRPGDTLENLALHYNVSVAALKTANRLYAPHALFLRATIVVPGIAAANAPLPPRPPATEATDSKPPAAKPAEDLTQLLANIDADVQTARARLPALQVPPPPPQKPRLYPPSSTTPSPMYTPRGTRRITVRPNAVVFDVGEVLASVAAEAMARPAEHTVLVTVLDGRNFVRKPNSKLYVQCRFNNEILTSDPVDHIPLPIFDTELTWDIDSKALGFFRSQRAQLKLVVYSVSLNGGSRDQLGYVMLDLRGAPEHSDGQEHWEPLLAAKSPGPFRPELKISFAVVPANAHREEEEFDASGGKKAPTQPPRPRPKPKIHDPKPVPPPPQSDRGVGRPGEFSLPVSLHRDGYYQIGDGNILWVLGITIAFAENVELFELATPLRDGQYFFSFTFMGNEVTTEPFMSLFNPVFSAERVSIRLCCSSPHLHTFIDELSTLCVYLKHGTPEAGSVSNILGYADITLRDLLSTDPSSSRLFGERDSTEIATVEKLYNLYDTTQQLRMSEDARVPSIGVSVTLAQESHDRIPSYNQNLSKSYDDAANLSRISNADLSRMPDESDFIKAPTNDVLRPAKPPSPPVPAVAKRLEMEKDPTMRGHVDPDYSWRRNAGAEANHNDESRQLDKEPPQASKTPFFENNQSTESYNQPSAGEALFHKSDTAPQDPLATPQSNVQRSNITPSSTTTGTTGATPLHQTQEYKVALELELWRADQERQFRSHLRARESQLLNDLASEFQSREKALDEKLAAFKTVEQKMQTLAKTLEQRDRDLDDRQKRLEDRARELEREAKAREVETRDLARRTVEECAHRVKREKQDAEEARKDRERDRAVADALRKEVDQLRKQLAYMPPPPPDKADRDADAAMIQKLTQKVAEEKRGRKYYKTLWVRTLNELATYRAPANARMPGPSPTRSHDDAPTVLGEIKRDLEELKSLHSRSIARHGSEADAGEAARDERSAPMDPRILAEIDRLAAERDSLLKGGVYNSSDRLVVELGLRIQQLMASGASI
ncbi:hypothetical protein HDU86_005895 [Geranomyces michiganensis]|nr:hypothetical protein HDU86_005895 [Geranomyces michiganensis]